MLCVRAYVRACVYGAGATFTNDPYQLNDGDGFSSFRTTPDTRNIPTKKKRERTKYYARERQRNCMKNETFSVHVIVLCMRG